MQLAEDGSRASGPSKSGFLSPGKAFALLFGVIVLLGGAIFLLRPDDLPRGQFTYPASEAPTFELTDAEAIARFEHLESLLISAYHERDPSLLDAFLTADSPLQTKIASEIRQLKADGVLDESEFFTRDVQVVANGDRSIIVTQVVEEDPLFVDERSGKDLTTKDVVLIERVEWTLRLDGSVWKIFDSEVIKSRVRSK